VGVKAGGVPRPCFPPIQPFPASVTAEGAQFNVPPSPAKGEGEGSGRRGNKQELNGPALPGETVPSDAEAGSKRRGLRHGAQARGG